VRTVGQSSRLRLQDVRAAFRLIGECRDLGDDAEAWRGHAFQGLGPLLSARAAKGQKGHAAQRQHFRGGPRM